MTNSSVLGYEIYAADKQVTREAIDRVRKAEAAINARSTKKNASSSDWLLRHFFPREQLQATSVVWRLDQPSITARAMAVGRDAVFVAGAPNFIDEREVYRHPDSPATLEIIQRQQAALAGKQGGVLWAISKGDGRVTDRFRLESVPVFDGMAAIDGALVVSSIDGRMFCLSSDAAEQLTTIDGQPDRIAWDEPEDPDYLVPVPVSKDDDFDQLRQCNVVESDLGYRLIPKAKGQTGLALKQLDKPITGKATLKARMSVPSETTGALQNGFLAFGQEETDDQLVKCGIRLKNGRASIVQGDLKEGTTKSTIIDAQAGKTIDLIVEVDLTADSIRYSANGQTVEAELDLTLQEIRYVGYAMDNAVVDFSEVQAQETD
jgi:hypothetical protein